ncbi:Glutamine-dependent NAD(+) synthetase [bacterium HR21]|uniref:Glutamine-dependent NAD(+) synthetase n=1 Tax=uncultured Chlorobiota bacterium TaxID=156405 RepID=H5SGL7_9BACT|nr:NAD+ synthase (glutamine-hydrolysing) [uncultured Chlorobiota bacterium]GBD06681.1 Glutamine-dependent NAD(+) synthetase [bacterium HR21]
MRIPLESYGFLRIALVSPELRVADVSFNARRIAEALRQAAQSGAHLVLFPELCLTGYTCGDLFYESVLRRAAWEALQDLLPLTEQLQLIAILGLPVEAGGRLFNCAAVLAHGQLCGVVPKTYLPNTGEFYERRWFASDRERVQDVLHSGGQTVAFGADLLFPIENLPGAVIGIEICEDLWAPQPPSSEMAQAGATVLLNLSSSNEVLGKAAYRRLLVQSQSGRCLAAYAYCSAGVWESTTDMVFSGHSLVAENGLLLAESPRFSLRTELLLVDIDVERLRNERLQNSTFAVSVSRRRYRYIPLRIAERWDEQLYRPLSPTPFVPDDAQEKARRAEEIFALQTRALARRLLHVGERTGVVVGISGGLDSTLALLVSAATMDLLGWERRLVHAVSMPGPGSTQRTQHNAQRLAQALGVTLHIIPITAALHQHLQDIGQPEGVHDVTYENAQARERTQILFDLANRLGALAVGTGDLSELALGWCTYGGDHLSFYAINAGVPKTLVRTLVQWCGQTLFGGEVALIVEDICATPISPELLPPAPGDRIRQATEELLGPFEVHDFVLFHMLRYHFAPRKIFLLAQLAFRERYTAEELLRWVSLFYHRFFAHQFKRSCLPDGPKVGTVALSPRGDWRMPSDAQVRLWLEELRELQPL